jgi:NAD(P)-dependent dehydrogenase (short-subunit alcohol dehydrogenase family)
MDTDLQSLRGKRILITGAARGIGAALAQRLAAHDARLALVGLEPDTLAASAAPSMRPPTRSVDSTSWWPTPVSPPAARCARRIRARGSV